ncbi:MAG TPA: hypothetical protein VHE09_15295 [Rhizomicrobium sp.]|jgi:hypothetical protein|nr:hypothetical protein [Rhizomicrobium sp.]
MKQRTIRIGAAVLLAGAITTSAEAGCLKGAAVGAVAGHFAHHHAVLGAIAGCAIGHHMAVEARKQNAAQQKHQQPSHPRQQSAHN